MLELVEGPTLADRIAQGAIPLDEALPIARQIAEALEAADEAGVIHRDLKPANIKVREDGTVKVLDFGLAKALDTTPQGDPSQSPTLTAAATQMGVIMGTAAYMSPEQAAGKPVDKRGDIWAFGVVLFEMLTGQRLFTGETVSHVLGAVLQVEPQWDTLPVPTPEALRRLLRRCLQKERKRRLRDVGDALTELDEALTAPPTFETTHAAIAQPASWRQALPLALGALIMGSLITGLAVWTMMRPAPPAPQLTARSTLTLPATDQLAQIPQLRLALSPDGSTLVYTAVRDGVTQLYRRELDQLEAVAIPGTENAIGPFFKPDGEWLAFASDGVLKKVALRGGPATTICDLQNAFRHATWTADDTIIFGVATSGLLRVPGAGGEPRSFLDLEEGEDVHQTPEVLPGDRAVLFRSTSGDRRVV